MREDSAGSDEVRVGDMPAVGEGGIEGGGLRE